MKHPLSRLRRLPPRGGQRQWPGRPRPRRSACGLLRGRLMTRGGCSGCGSGLARDGAHRSPATPIAAKTCGPERRISAPAAHRSPATPIAAKAAPTRVIGAQVFHASRVAPGAARNRYALFSVASSARLPRTESIFRSGCSSRRYVAHKSRLQRFPESHLPIAARSDGGAPKPSDCSTCCAGASRRLWAKRSTAAGASRRTPRP